MNLLRSILALSYIGLSTAGMGQVKPNGQTQPNATTQTLNTIPAAYAGGTPVNYVRTFDALKPFAQDTLLSSSSRTVQEVRQSTQYIDGLGRGLQTVIKGVSPNGYDMVSPEIYDQYGREVYNYVPYVSPSSDGSFKNNPFNEQNTFATNFYNPTAVSNGEKFFYGQTVTEGSPLDRTLAAYAPGNSWEGSAKGTTKQYLFNKIGDSVQVWKVSNGMWLTVSVGAISGSNQSVTYNVAGLPSSNITTILWEYKTSGGSSWNLAYSSGNLSTVTASIPVGTYVYAIQIIYSDGTPSYTLNQSNTPASIYDITGVYPTGSLYKFVTTDENGNEVIEYKDIRGLTLLKKVQAGTVTDAQPYTNWLCTYYLYDDDKNLRFVIPPLATSQLRNSNWAFDSSALGSSALGAELCYRYEYDGRGRMYVRKVPGAGEFWMVYDARDRLIMTQDSSLRAQGKWLYTGYDSLNRPILTGIWANASNQFYHQSQAYNSITYPAPTSGYTVLTQTYFDDYSWVSGSGSGLGSTAYTGYNSNTNDFYTASDATFPYPRALTATNLTHGLITGDKINVINTSSYVYSVSFYDDRARVIQSQRNNYTGKIDTAITQYDFNGQVLRTLLCHGKGGTNPQGYQVLNKNTYDAAGRVTLVTQKTGNSIETVIALNKYDELGELQQKNLGDKRNSDDSTYSSAPLDSLLYTYNVRGWLRGINKDYANAINSNNYFGMELDYDFGFSASQLNGNISGIKWRNANDGAQRAYGFTYDGANRLIQADFTQNSGGSTWDLSAGIDFSVHGISYDANGNILTLKQMGLKVNASQIIDSLIYGYNTTSNKINYVTDLANDTSAHLGDFTEITKNTNQDYWYDGNGNLTKDNNKNIANIHYNYLNLPDSITFTGKGTIKYTYTAAGEKIQKIVTDTVPSPDKITRTDYVGAFVYQNDTLQYASTPEGRARPKTVNQSSMMLYDYFEKDHLGNTRVVLTDEIEQDLYPAATLETLSGVLQVEQTFYTINMADTMSTSRIASWPTTTLNNYKDNNGNPPYNNNPSYTGSSDTATSKIVYKLNGSTGDKTGLGIALKVMKGDVVSIYGKSFWHNTTTVQNIYRIASALTTFLTSFAGTSAVVSAGKGSAGTIATDVNNNIADANGLRYLLDTAKQSTYAGSTPRAYINWILFDEQFKPITTSSSFDQVSTTYDFVKSHAKTISIPQGGYLYVYCSNESNIDVYFDNLQVIDTRGPVLETDNYYPFGLTMAGISSKAAGKLENLYKANGSDELQHKEFSDGSGLEAYDANFRMYDAQIGRFWQIDPLADFAEDQSAYSFVDNNPVSFADPLGLTDSTKTTTAPGYPNSTTGANNLTPVTVTTTAKSNPTLGFVGTPPGDVPGFPGLRIPPPDPGGTTVDPPVPTTTTPETPVELAPVEVGAPEISMGIGLPAMGLTAVFTAIPIWGGKNEGSTRPAPDIYKKPKPANPPTEGEKEKPLYLVRFGLGPESRESLAKQAAAALATGRFPYGVSTVLRTRISGTDLTKNRYALLSTVMRFFPGTRQTGSTLDHYTVEFTNPLSQGQADTFNTLFAR